MEEIEKKAQELYPNEHPVYYDDPNYKSPECMAFLEGYQQAKQDKWVSVEKNLYPKTTGCYLIYCVENNMIRVHEGWWNGTHFTKPCYQEGDYLIWDKVTHWQPLPQPPKR